VNYEKDVSENKSPRKLISLRYAIVCEYEKLIFLEFIFANLFEQETYEIKIVALVYNPP